MTVPSSMIHCKQRSRDGEDDPYPSAAVSAQAQCLVPYDRDLLVLEKPFGRKEGRFVDGLLGPVPPGNLLGHRAVQVAEQGDDGLAPAAFAGLHVSNRHRQEPLRSPKPPRWRFGGLEKPVSSSQKAIGSSLCGSGLDAAELLFELAEVHLDHRWAPMGAGIRK